VSFIWLKRKDTTESDNGHRYSTPTTPPRVSVVELTVDLIQLVLQPGEGDIIANPKQMGWFSPVVDGFFSSSVVYFK